MGISRCVGVANSKVELEIIVGPEEEVRRGVTRSRAREIKVRGADENLTEVQLEQFVAELEVMASANPAQRVTELIVTPGKSRRKARTEIEVTANIHRHSTRRNVLRHVDSQVCRSQRRSLQLVRRRIQIGKRELIQKRRAESVEIADYQMTRVLLEAFADVAGNIPSAANGDDRVLRSAK